MTIRYNVRYLVTVCPKCETEIMGGQHRFGPTQVQCNKCKQVIETGLTPWANLPGSRKALIAISELFVPSWNFPIRAFFGNLLAWLFVSMTLGLLLMFIVVGLFFNSSDNAIAPYLVVTIPVITGFILVPFQRLVRMIIESNKYSKTGIAPVWKISRWLKK